MTERDRLIAILAKLALRRQADVGQFTFEVYADDLLSAHVEIEDADAVCHRLGTQPRADYTTLYPAVGDLLQACAARKRNRRETALIASAPVLALPAPLPEERAKVWLDRLKHTARYGGSARDAAQRFPMPSEVRDE